jgi:hypothetical protein
MKKMTCHFDAAGRAAPEAFVRVVEHFAAACRLPAEPLIAGQGIDNGELVYWLVHHGDDDPQGVTLMIDAGPPPDDPQVLQSLTRHLLEAHVLFPVAWLGYYGFLAHLSRLVLCVRIALDEAPDVPSAAEAIAAVINQHTLLKQQKRN